MGHSDRILDSRAPAATASASGAPAAGQVLGRYRLLDLVGAGGFSVVWRAENTATGRVVALKLPRNPDFIAHLRREVRIAAIVHDPQVAGILESRLDHDPPFLAMPFVAGTDLALPGHAPPPERIVDAFRAFEKIARVVSRLHRAGVVHGDLKPGNIRVGPDGLVHLLDLGLARHQVSVRQNSTLRASVVSVTGEKIAGTLEFMAPEVMSGGAPGAASDVYALGVVLHALLCGRPPAFGVSPGDLNPYLPPGTTDFLRQMLHADPSMRPPDAGALLPAVDAFIRAEERCLRRRNGHARRLVFCRRMKTLARGVRALGLVASLALLLVFGIPVVKPPAGLGAIAAMAALPFACIGFLLGVTTINAWILGVPERTYKNRRGHPWWTFMMQ